MRLPKLAKGINWFRCTRQLLRDSVPIESSAEKIWFPIKVPGRYNNENLIFLGVEITLYKCILFKSKFICQSTQKLLTYVNTLMVMLVLYLIKVLTFSREHGVI